MEYAYQQKKGKEMRTARARLMGVNASYKDLCEVCRNVRGRGTEDALEFLGLAAEMKKAIYFARNNTGKGHRRELGGRKGGWPVKSVKFVLEVLKNAAANANRLGLSATKIVHIVANKQDVYPRMSPKGRRIRHNYETAFIEIVLGEVQERAEDKAAKSSQKKPADAKAPSPKQEERKPAAQIAAGEKKPPAASPVPIAKPQ